jgi:hypothetical protein
MADINDVEAAITQANIQAQAQYASAQVVATANVQAHVQAEQVQAKAQISIAGIVAEWQKDANNAQRDVAHTTSDANLEGTKYAADRQVDAEGKRADATKYAADQQRDADKYVSDNAIKNQIDLARIALEGQEFVAQVEGQWHISVAQVEADATKYAADQSFQASTQSATIEGTYGVQQETIRADAARDVATITTSNQVAVANIDAKARTDTATITGNFAVQTTQAEGVWHESVATTEQQASNYRADQELAGVNAHETAETNRLNIKLNFANTIYNEIKPLLDQIVTAGTNFLNSGGGSDFRPPGTPMGFRMCSQADVSAGAGGGGNTMGFYSRRVVDEPPSLTMGPLDPPQDAGQGGGGSSTTNVTVTVPYIATRGVFTPAMLQQQVNQAYARNDARTQSQIREAQGDLAGRGFSSNSPILDALQVGYTLANLRASVEAASQIRLQAAQANVDAVFRGQEARSEQFLKQEDVLVSEAQVVVQRQVGILNAVAQLVGGIL